MTSATKSFSRLAKIDDDTHDWLSKTSEQEGKDIKRLIQEAVMVYRFAREGHSITFVPSIQFPTSTTDANT